MRQGEGYPRVRPTRRLHQRTEGQAGRHRVRATRSVPRGSRRGGEAPSRLPRRRGVVLRVRRSVAR